MKTLYAAYGSNMNLDQMKKRCPGARCVGPAILKNHTLTFRREKGVANVEPKQGEHVPLLIWELTEDCEKALDRYEGVPNVYEKKYLKISVNGEECIALFYIMIPPLWNVLGIPTLEYYETIRQGYLTSGFDPYYLDKRVDAIIDEYEEAQKNTDRDKEGAGG